MPWRFMLLPVQLNRLFLSQSVLALSFHGVDLFYLVCLQSRSYLDLLVSDLQQVELMAHVVLENGYFNASFQEFLLTNDLL